MFLSDIVSRIHTKVTAVAIIGSVAGEEENGRANFVDATKSRPGSLRTIVGAFGGVGTVRGTDEKEKDELV